MFQHAGGSISGAEPANTLPRGGGALRLHQVSKSYGGILAVDDVSIALARGEFVTLLGPSGSGKTTLLMMIAGFVTPTNGEILLDDRNVTTEPPENRNLGMVFQGYALFPHMTVAGNVAFPLEVRKMPKSEIDSRVRQVLEQVQLGSLGSRYPRQLSGGQQQRVALARALVFMPDLLLLDEPLSALDRKLRADVQLELKALHRQLGLTFIYVTHDQEEALSMSDRVVVLRNGRIVQQGTPSELYERPRTRFVADFLGKSNFVPGLVESIRPNGFSYRWGQTTLFQTGKMAKPGSRVLLALRPEKIEIVTADRRLPNQLTATVVNWTYTGAAFHLLVNTRDENQISLTVPTWRQSTCPEVGEEITIGWDSNAAVSVDED
jgi:putative spermidine/putrescine transport system ATP-binding protein